MALVFNIERITDSQLRGQRRHDQRTDNPLNCDPSRRHLNRVLAGTGDPVADTAHTLAQHRAKPRADNDRPYDRIVLSASPDELDTPQKVAAFEARSMKWLRKTWGPGLAYAVAHLDERTYHIHAVVVPLYSVESRGQTRHRVSHRLHPATKGKDSYARLRRDASRSLGLEYGEPGGKPQALAQRRTLEACSLIEDHAKRKAQAVLDGAEDQVALSLRIAHGLRQEAAEDRRQAAKDRHEAWLMMESAAKERRALDRERAQVVAVGATLASEARQQGEDRRAQTIQASVAQIEPQAQAARRSRPSRDITD